MNTGPGYPTNQNPNFRPGPGGQNPQGFGGQQAKQNMSKGGIQLNPSLGNLAYIDNKLIRVLSSQRPHRRGS